MAEIKTEEITWDDVKVSNYIIVEQNVEAEGPRRQYRIVWAGKVVEHTLKWTKVKHDGKVMPIPVRWGQETITRVAPRDFKKYLKQIGI